MIIYIIKNGKIESFVLPSTINGSYWLFDVDKNNEKRSLVSVTSSNNEWQINSNSDVKICDKAMSKSFVEKEILTPNSFYRIYIAETKEFIVLYSCLRYDDSYNPYEIKNSSSITIGKAAGNGINYNFPIFRDIEATLIYKDNYWYIQSAHEASQVYLNKELIFSSTLKCGDTLFILGLKIICMGNFFVINNPNNLMSVNPMILFIKQLPNIDNIDVNINEDLLEDNNDNYFYRSPRFRTIIKPESITIDAPPEQQMETPTSVIATVGPMIIMSIVSMISIVVAINELKSGGNMLNAVMALSMGVSMLTMSIVWPTINNRFQKSLTKKRERLRQTRYTQYIDKNAANVKNIINIQRNILIENNIPLEECQAIILNRKRNLWERKSDHDDFLRIRLGTGNETPQIDIKLPDEHFRLFDDNLLDYVKNTFNNLNEITNVPVTMSLTEKFVSSVIASNYNYGREFIDLLLFQIMTFQSYEDVKIVLMTSEEKSKNWEYLKTLPHIWNNSNTSRFYGTTNDEIKQISNYLEVEFAERLENKNTQEKEFYKSCSPYYVIIVDDLKAARNSEIVKKILGHKNNLGFSVLFHNDKLSEVPNECFTFVSVDKASCGIFENDLVAEKQRVFQPINKDGLDLNACYEKLANIQIKLEKTIELPNTIGFLEMFQVGNINQLNILNKWQKNNPSISLGVPVGVDESGEHFKLDLHEKFHGPHGLIAGMTGSGKSEFIVTFILSLAINFCPDEVTFVIIDYKGGGLAGAFFNKETGVKLPHLVGTITNLDKSEMNRSVASIESELKRRQELFNQTREKFNESTLDIYKYQRFYREKKVDIPLPHLFIISDEFAELKTQQPDFMASLMSIARIGRSLGVHLILATQKPSGVVNEQIWSNSKFRVCLKVQERSDSLDMLKREDAASLKEVGRFYLQVGYNELFKLGQSAWCGVQYLESDKIKKNVDTSISFVDNTGYTVKSIDTEKKNEAIVSKGDELTNIVAYLSGMAKESNIEAIPLWLDTIPAYINLMKLYQKYNFRKENFNINVVIGEYDIPSKQKQNILTIPLVDEGNIAIYGVAGAGKEHLLTTLIYSAVANYTTDEVNFYIIDLGAEALKVFKNIPHVGDIILLDDVEKLNNLFKFVKQEITQRKKLFSEYNGSYNDYCKNSGSTLPTIVIVLNNYEAFSDVYGDFEDQLVSYTRECTKFGITFILTSTTSTGLRYRMRQNFKTEIVLRLTDTGDYQFLLPGAKNMEPAKFLGRGLITRDAVYEFQTASICEDASRLNETISALSKKLNELYPIPAMRIPVLPKVVTLDVLKPNLKDLTSVPIGIDTNKLSNVVMDFKANKGYLFVSEDTNNFEHFAPLFIKQVMSLSGVFTFVIDGANLYSKSGFNSNSYFNSNFDNVFNSLYNYTDKIVEKMSEGSDDNSLSNFQDVICFITDVKIFKDSLSEENADKFEELIDRMATLNKMSLVFIDSLNNVKDLNYESWFSKYVKLNNVLWVGRGLDDQMTVRTTAGSRDIQNEIGNNYAYQIKNGELNLLKLLYDEDESVIED